MPALHVVRIMSFYSRKTIDAYQNKYPFRLWWKHKAAISGCEASRKKFTGPKEGRFHEIEDAAVFKFFRERRKTGLFASYDLLRKEAIKKARYFNTPRSRFKASRGWAVRFMCRIGLALRRRMICQKLPKDFEQKLLNYQRYITNLRKTGTFLMGQMANADERPFILVCCQTTR